MSYEEIIPTKLVNELLLTDRITVDQLRHIIEKLPQQNPSWLTVCSLLKGDHLYKFIENLIPKCNI